MEPTDAVNIEWCNTSSRGLLEKDFNIAPSRRDTEDVVPASTSQVKQVQAQARQSPVISDVTLGQYCRRSSRNASILGHAASEPFHNHDKDRNATLHAFFACNATATYH